MRRDGIQPRCETFETCESAHRQAGLAAKGAAWAAGAARTGSAGRFHRRQCQWRARCPVQERGRPGFVYKGGFRHIGKSRGIKTRIHIEVRRRGPRYELFAFVAADRTPERHRQRRVPGDAPAPWGCVPRGGSRSERVKNAFVKAALTYAKRRGPLPPGGWVRPVRAAAGRRGACNL